ncbi:hypothetical protein PFICI_14327 [Pestalotiopsis fici W106-1]|uniref:Myb-like domain-containing protein n=1 Tax=Pestalotiopsis fici (strain W106-1 / CGMCC3.15140) TaxID=1229662 RepID=W3WNQ9_PESFW|nr:uncharacterized protein PFICI_14327 [Pestalotiopsis fici W106-1]ETS74461.1 hypothetical protein PFICI_14327 [Pestalotiopsis fici W106-1]
MADTAADKGKEGKGWTPEEELDLVLAAMYQSNRFAAVPWDAVAEQLQKKFPTKTKEGCRQKFAKLKNVYITKFEVDPNETGGVAKGKATPKTPRKCNAASGDANEAGEANGTPSAKKPRSNKKAAAAAAAAAKQAEEENATIEEEGEV